MIHFNRLRLSGFKSFVDQTEMVIEPGLTGVVGPNGCGKSNLVEALRWVMGEMSAKQMRGGEMDDVIFGGTASRPARNIAEVTLVLDNGERNAPAQFNDFETLEVVRRIERGQGSLYRVNGKDSRARDVQVLFADAASGARSTAIVSQGRIGAIISAKPTDRRGLLEEAAGISGLHARRHEAELRLKAAEDNLLRLEDVLAGLDTQLQGLKRQAKQAARYRALSEQIRQAEAGIMAARWRAAQDAIQAAEETVTQAAGHVASLTGLAARAAAYELETAEALPGLRQAETDAAGLVHRLSLQREQLDGDEARLAEAQRDITVRLDQTNADLQREVSRAQDAATAIARLSEEGEQLANAGGDETVRQQTAAAALAAAQAENERVEADMARLMAEVAAADAERGAAFRALNDTQTRREKLTQRSDEFSRQRAQAALEIVDQADLTSAEMDLEEALEYLETCRTDTDGAERRKVAAQAARDTAREDLQAITASRTKLAAEAAALAELLAHSTGSEHPPMLDQISVSSGLEVALGVALGEDLSAPIAADSPFAWRYLPPLADAPPLPAGAEPLTRHVSAPPALARRLAQVGLVADTTQGEALLPLLRPGQRLVTLDGAGWRWDGYTVRAGAPSPAAARLRQRNRRRELTVQIEDADLGVAAAQASVQSAAAAADLEAAAERAARDKTRQADADLAKLRDNHHRLTQRAATAQSRLVALADQEMASRADLAEATAAEEAARLAVEKFTGNDAGRETLARLRVEVAEKRMVLVEARAVVERLQRESADRMRRLQAIVGEQASWAERAQTSARHHADLCARRDQLKEEADRLASLPTTIAERRRALLDETDAASRSRRAAADSLAAAEAALGTAHRAAKEAESALAAAREDKIRREAAWAQAAQMAESVAVRIAERLDMTPQALLASQPDRGGAEDVASLEARFERQTRERDALGAINLRADAEAETLEAQIAELHAERHDLTAAIARLRRAIADINRDGRERLLASFETVDTHFRRLFVRLFGGGRAHLTLTESPDPLQAGLEIMASPPGKRLQALSLLSGGEQALTALALLFAVFMTNPAPICVLDEVDAPLDDANVDRFCTLVEEIAHASRTRFLVVTHHRMTMARMDRLFGVTMAERGVSTLVSVDLASAEGLREPV